MFTKSEHPLCKAVFHRNKSFNSIFLKSIIKTLADFHRKYQIYRSLKELLMYVNGTQQTLRSKFIGGYKSPCFRAWLAACCTLGAHDDAIKSKRFPRYCPFVRGIHRSPVDSPHKGQWRGALMFSLICTWTNSWANNGDAGDFRRHRVHYNNTVTKQGHLILTRGTVVKVKGFRKPWNTQVWKLASVLPPTQVTYAHPCIKPGTLQKQKDTWALNSSRPSDTHMLR